MGTREKHPPQHSEGIWVWHSISNGSESVDKLTIKLRSALLATLILAMFCSDTVIMLRKALPYLYNDCNKIGLGYFVIASWILICEEWGISDSWTDESRTSTILKQTYWKHVHTYLHIGSMYMRTYWKHLWKILGLVVLPVCFLSLKSWRLWFFDMLKV